MNYEQILAWGKRWHYPQLILDENHSLQYGEANYQALCHDCYLQLLVTQRILRWNQLAGVSLTKGEARQSEQESIPTN
jgi:hypothetical protein